MLRNVPVDRVVHLAGVSAEGVVAAAARGDDLPAAVVVTPPATGTPAAFVADVLRALDASVTAAGFHRDRLVLAIPLGAEPAVVAGSEWLADRGRLGVWLTGATAPSPGRVTTVHVGPLPPPPPPRLVAGTPHPRSTVEAALEAVLARRPWAYGRVWNSTYQPEPLRLPIRPDLLWPAERVVVELDGPEHCRPDRYDDDRVRDVRLQLDGYAVLRFTNARVRHDVQAVAAQIEQLIRTRRHDMAKGPHGG